MQFSPAPHKLGYDLHDTEIANLMITFPVAFMGICINAAEQSRVQPYAFVCPPTASANFLDSVEGGGDEMPRLFGFRGTCRDVLDHPRPVPAGLQSPWSWLPSGNL